MSKHVQDIQSEMAELGWKEFEYFIADLWELQGYSAERTGHHDPEGEDVIAIQQIPFNLELLIQTKCKQIGNKINKKTIHIHALDAGADADLSVIVTTSSFTRPATNLANRRKRTKLVDGESVAEMVKRLNAEELLNDYLKADSPNEPNVEQYKTRTEESDGVREIKGIAEGFEKQLADADIHTVSDLSKINPEDVADETDIAESRLERWVVDAAYQEGEIDTVEQLVSDDEVQSIYGIGSGFATRLKDADIETTVDLAVANPKEISQQTEINESKIREWGQRARRKDN